MLDDGFPLRGEVIGQVLQQGYGIRLRNGQVPQQAAQQFHFLQQGMQRLVLVVGELVDCPHIIGGFGLYGDMQDSFVAVLALHGFFLGGDGAHIPKHLPQTFHPVRVKGGNVHAILCGGRLAGKNRKDFPPVRGLAVNLDAVIVARLQARQFLRVLHVDLRDGRIGGNGIRLFLLVGKEDTKGGRHHSGHQHDYTQGQQEDSAAHQPHKGADEGSHRMDNRLRRFLSQIGRGLRRLFGPLDGQLPRPYLSRLAHGLFCSRPCGGFCGSCRLGYCARGGFFCRGLGGIPTLGRCCGLPGLDRRGIAAWPLLDCRLRFAPGSKQIVRIAGGISMAMTPRISRGRGFPRLSDPVVRR